VTVAELLVQTTATLMAGYESAETTPTERDIGLALGNSRRIVAAVYGEPCVDGLDGFTAADDLPFELHGTGGEACIVCGWPRSQHTVKP